MFGVVDAEGADDLAVQLLVRAGFLRSVWDGQTVYHLPSNLDEQRQNEMAGDAAQMLTAARYTVILDPDLRAPEAPHGADPQDSHSAGAQVRQLTDRMLGADSYARAAHHAEQALHPDFGVLARLSEFFEAAAEQAQASDTEEGWELHYQFAEAADTLTALGEQLVDTPAELRELGPPEHSRTTDRTADHNATAAKQPVTPTPAAARPTPPAYPAPAPRRR
ncbi:hypothetical protein ACWDBF_07705 [Streptomyces angustmyceticus]